jgi:hypothetical protein
MLKKRVATGAAAFCRRFLATVSVAAVAVTGPAAFGASSASAAEPTAGTTVTMSAASGPINCNPGELRGKANYHTQRAADYQILLARELLKENPDKEKVARYDKMVKAHQKKADEYHAKADRCLDAEQNQ